MCHLQTLYGWMHQTMPDTRSWHLSWMDPPFGAYILPLNSGVCVCVCMPVVIYYRASDHKTTL